MVDRTSGSVTGNILPRIGYTAAQSGSGHCERTAQVRLSFSNSEASRVIGSCCRNRYFAGTEWGHQTARARPASGGQNHGTRIHEHLCYALISHSPRCRYRSWSDEHSHTIGDTPAVQQRRGIDKVLIHAGPTGADECMLYPASRCPRQGYSILRPPRQRYLRLDRIEIDADPALKRGL
jgi:hypothetical protein